MAKRKERETELLGFSEKLSSSNAELQTERSDWEAKVWCEYNAVWMFYLLCVWMQVRGWDDCKKLRIKDTSRVCGCGNTLGMLFTQTFAMSGGILEFRERPAGLLPDTHPRRETSASRGAFQTPGGESEWSDKTCEHARGQDCGRWAYNMQLLLVMYLLVIISQWLVCLSLHSRATVYGIWGWARASESNKKEEFKQY